MKRNTTVAITSFNFVTGHSNERAGSRVTTIAALTLAIHRRMITEREFVVEMGSLVAEYGDWVLFKVYAKERTKDGVLVDQFIEFPTALVSTKDGYVPEDVVALLQEMVNSEEGLVREDKAAELIGVLEGTKVGVVRKDIAFPITREFRHHCTGVVFEAIRKRQGRNAEVTERRPADRRIRYQAA